MGFNLQEMRVLLRGDAADVGSVTYECKNTRHRQPNDSTIARAERPLVPTLFARTFVDWRNAHVPFADARIAPAARESAQAIGTIESRRAAPRFRIESGSRAKRGRPRERPFGVTREARVREAHGPTADAPWASLERSGTPRPRSEPAAAEDDRTPGALPLPSGSPAAPRPLPRAEVATTPGRCYSLSLAGPGHPRPRRARPREPPSDITCL